MNKFLVSKLAEKVGTTDFMSVDFLNLSENLLKDDIVFYKTRGSVRLSDKNILLPSDVRVQKNKVLKMDFES